MKFLLTLMFLLGLFVCGASASQDYLPSNQSGHLYPGVQPTYASTTSVPMVNIAPAATFTSATPISTPVNYGSAPVTNYQPHVSYYQPHVSNLVPSYGSGRPASSSGLAQQKADQAARMRLRGHVGGGLGSARYEGVGWSNVSAQSAIQSCCYWGSRPTYQIGVSRGADGFWYACVLYN